MPKTQQDLREMVYHTDARVTAMEGQITTIGNNQLRSEQKIDQLINVINSPRQVNWAAWAGVCLTIIIMIVGGLFGVAQYVALVNEPQVQDINYNRTSIGEMKEWQNQTHYEFGVSHSVQDRHSKDIEEMWDRMLEFNRDIADLRERVAKGEVSRKAIGDFVKDMDAYGTRRWDEQE